jgi:hypothetical protein
VVEPARVRDRAREAPHLNARLYCTTTHGHRR